MGRWTLVGGSTGYGEKVFPNRKVGHVLAHPQPVPGRTKPKFESWRASLDGISCGFAKTMEEAQLRVDFEYKERYG